MKSKVIVCAAAAAVCTSLAVHLPERRIAVSDARTLPDETRVITIARGLKATCTGDTTLRWAASRFVIRLWLRGHCLVEATHDPSRRIELYTPMTEVLDVGTVFDVDTKGSVTVVTTLEGSVQLLSLGSHPVDMGAVRSDEQAAIVWRNGVLSSDIHGTPPEDQERLSLLRAGFMHVNGTVADAVDAFNRNNHWPKLRLHHAGEAARGHVEVTVGIHDADGLIVQLHRYFPNLAVDYDHAH